MGGSRFHSPILTRLAAARCAITDAPGWRWKNPIISGKRSSRRTCNRMSRVDREPTRSRGKARSRVNDCHGRSAKWGSSGFIHARAKQLDGVSDNLPNTGEMLLRREDIAKAKTHHGAATKLG